MKVSMAVVERSRVKEAPMTVLLLATLSHDYLYHTCTLHSHTMCVMPVHYNVQCIC
jgi:hypothetical protein